MLQSKSTGSSLVQDLSKTARPRRQYGHFFQLLEGRKTARNQRKVLKNYNKNGQTISLHTVSSAGSFSSETDFRLS